LTFVAGLAVATAIETMYGLSAGLKWPNDIYFHGRKCGGILTESSGFCETRKKPFAIVGIGLNVNTKPSDFPDELIKTATSLFIESGTVNDVETVFSEVRLELLQQVSQFETHGFSQVLEKWRKRDFMFGKKLAWVAINGRVVDGTSLGPDEQGRLHILDEYGVEHEVLSGDIRLAISG
jgi:BirA family biotin operon repressor/biotin-[acetyl-CoA-carboxylase] ligase